MALPGTWTPLLATDLDARDDGDSQIAKKARDRDHVNTEKLFHLGHGEVVSSSTLGVLTTILEETRWFTTTDEKLKYVLDAKRAAGGPNFAARITFTITPLGGGAVIGPTTVDTSALATSYSRERLVVTLNDDIRHNHATVKLEVETLSSGKTVTVVATDNDHDATVSRTLRDNDP